MSTGREKLIKIGAKVVDQGRYVTFQLAEVAVTRGQFRNILQLIDEFRPPPTPRTRLLSLMGPIGYNRSNLQGPLGKIGQNAYFSVQSKTNRGLGRTGGYGVRKSFVDWSSK